MRLLFSIVVMLWAASAASAQEARTADDEALEACLAETYEIDRFHCVDIAPLNCPPDTAEEVQCLERAEAAWARLLSRRVSP